MPDSYNSRKRTSSPAYLEDSRRSKPNCGDHDLTLRRQIVQESAIAARQQSKSQRRAPSQRYVKTPKFAGMATFDSHHDFRQLQVRESENRATDLNAHRYAQTTTPETDGGVSEDPEILELGFDEYHASITKELDEISKASELQAAVAYPPSNNGQTTTSECIQSVTTKESNGLQSYLPVDAPSGLHFEDFRTVGDNSESSSHEDPSKQPSLRMISQEQLVAEVKGIYAGLVMVEKKCMEIDTQRSDFTKRLSSEQWKALVALHRTLLQEHHDFFLASQHPAASDPLRRLAVKYAMPARMWRHGIHSFMELIRHRTPQDTENMLSFIYLAYATMASLRENCPDMENEWDIISDNLDQYLRVLSAEGIQIPESYMDAWSSNRSPESSLRSSSGSPSAAPHSQLDDDLRSWYLSTCPPVPDLLPEQVEDQYESLGLRLSDTVLKLMSGWLYFGQRIAKDFNGYCKLFKYLAWIGVSMS